MQQDNSCFNLNTIIIFCAAATTSIELMRMYYFYNSMDWVDMIALPTSLLMTYQAIFNDDGQVRQVVAVAEQPKINHKDDSAPTIVLLTPNPNGYFAKRMKAMGAERIDSNDDQALYHYKK